MSVEGCEDVTVQYSGVRENKGTLRYKCLEAPLHSADRDPPVNKGPSFPPGPPGQLSCQLPSHISMTLGYAGRLYPG